MSHSDREAMTKPKPIDSAPGESLPITDSDANSSQHREPAADESVGRGADPFVETRWTLVQRLHGTSESRARAAMNELCYTYWYPLYCYVRRRAFSPEDAEDITQGFMQHVIEKEIFAQADASRGKLRAYLLFNLKNFLSNWRTRENAIKRGGGVRPLSLDYESAENRFRREPACSDLSPEQIYDRRWALTLLDNVLARLRTYYRDNLRKEDLFEVLKSTIYGSADASYADIATDLGVSESTVKSEVHRIRQRFRQHLEQHIADTVSSARDFNDELRYLVSLFQ